MAGAAQALAATDVFPEATLRILEARRASPARALGPADRVGLVGAIETP
jgi:hypothetical protein